MKTLTYSSTSMFKVCRTKYDLLYNRQLKAIDEPVYFSIGSAYHKALEYHYNGSKEDVIVEEVIKYFHENKPDTDDQEKLSKWEAAAELTQGMVIRYLEEYPIENFEVVATEMEFEVPIINPDTGRESKLYNFKGKIDGLILQNGLHWIIEHKTTSQMTDLYKKGLFLDTQSVAYIEALERFLDIKVAGVLYNVSLKSIPRMPKMNKNGKLSTAKNQNTTEKLFLEAIKEHKLNEDDYREYLDYLSTKNKEFFYREYLVFPKEVIQEWRYELWQIAKDIRQAEIENRWYKNTSQCTAMGTCLCFDICTAIDKGYIIENNFMVKEKANEELTEVSVKPF